MEEMEKTRKKHLPKPGQTYLEYLAERQKRKDTDTHQMKFGEILRDTKKKSTR